MSTTQGISSKSFRVLVVDDEEPLRKVLKRYLEHEKLVVETAAGADEADELMDSMHFDMLITDIRMPGRHGHSLLSSRMEKGNPELLVAITGLTEPRIVRDLIRRGVTDLCFKPLEYDLFAAKMKALLLRHVAEPKKSAQPEFDITAQISAATDALNAQLANITNSFKDTIRELEAEKERIGKGFVGSLRVLSSLVSQVGQGAASHSGRVEQFAEAIGSELGLNEKALRDLSIAALLHDLGQFGMPDEVKISAPWTLTPKLRTAYEQYPIIGGTLISEVPGTAEIVDLIEAHTENFDGTGFPDGLKGERIPLGARIIRIADGLDTFSMYTKRNATVADYHAHLKEYAGTWYDPKLAARAASAIRAIVEAEDPALTIRITAAELQPGQVIAQDVYDAQGQFLVRSGAIVTSRMLTRLQKLLVGQEIGVLAGQGALVGDSD